MWNLIINDRYKIVSNEKQYIIQESYNSKVKGTDETVVKWKNATSHCKLSDAVSALYERGVRCADVKTVADAMNASQEWLHTLTKVFSPEGVQVVRVL